MSENGRRCECCGTPKALELVRVEALADGERSSLVLCGRCLQREHAAWRSTWRLVERVLHPPLPEPEGNPERRIEAL